MFNIESYIPITVFTALSIFIIKEIIEIIKKYTAEKRKLSAIKKVIAMECELNYWTLKKVVSALKDINDACENGYKDSLSIYTPKYGVQRIRIKDGSRFHEYPLPYTHYQQHEKYIVDIAQMDKKFFNSIESSFSAIKELEHIRQNIINKIQEEEDRNFLSGLPFYGLREAKNIENLIKQVYKICTGEEIKARLR